ncbi:MAG TPA: nuclear transport factor 2 family protein [Dehalococcoidia bacterium]|nr:nuclear transport factor 2 family protein [Dehalococcoidia bacterium]
MGADENITIVLETFRAVERRDRQRLNELYHPEVEFRWPPSLVSTLGSERVELWDELQPTAAEREMDPRVVAAAGDEVVVLWHWRAASPSGAYVAEPVLGLYRVRDGKFARAQKFFFDAAAVAAFIARVKRERAGAPGEATSTAPV